MLNGAAVPCGFLKLRSVSCMWVAPAYAKHQPCGLGCPHIQSDLLAQIEVSRPWLG